MMDDLQKAYAAYQQALYHLPNPKVGSILFVICPFAVSFVVVFCQCI